MNVPFDVKVRVPPEVIVTEAVLFAEIEDEHPPDMARLLIVIVDVPAVANVPVVNVPVPDAIVIIAVEFVAVFGAPTE